MFCMIIHPHSIEYTLKACAAKIMYSNFLERRRVQDSSASQWGASRFSSGSPPFFDIYNLTAHNHRFSGGQWIFMMTLFQFECSNECSPTKGSVALKQLDTDTVHTDMPYWSQLLSSIWLSPLSQQSAEFYLWVLTQISTCLTGEFTLSFIGLLCWKVCQNIT